MIPATTPRRATIVNRESKSCGKPQCRQARPGPGFVFYKAISTGEKATMKKHIAAHRKPCACLKICSSSRKIIRSTLLVPHVLDVLFQETPLSLAEHTYCLGLLQLVPVSPGRILLIGMRPED